MRVAYTCAPHEKTDRIRGLLGVLYLLGLQHGTFNRAVTPGEVEAATVAPAAVARSSESCNEETLSSAYRKHESRVEVCGHGVIAKVLKDDTQGTRHQRFVVRLPSDQTILIAYNFDLAPRIEGLRAGVPIEFSGGYEWNGQGGVVHWTHRDPGGRHVAGWLRYAGQLYQ